MERTSTMSNTGELVTGLAAETVTAVFFSSLRNKWSNLYTDRLYAQTYLKFLLTSSI